MKPKLPLYLASFVAATIVAFLPMVVTAQSLETTAECARTPEDYVSPGTLVTMAYRGAFEEEGIPGYGVLASEVKQGSITAEDIVQEAIKGCVLSNKYGMAENDNYVSDVGDEIEVRIRENQ